MKVVASFHIRPSEAFGGDPKRAKEAARALAKVPGVKVLHKGDRVITVTADTVILEAMAQKKLPVRVADGFSSDIDARQAPEVSRFVDRIDILPAPTPM